MKKRNMPASVDLLRLVYQMGALDIEKDHHGNEIVWPMGMAVKLCKTCRKLTGQRNIVAGFDNLLKTYK